MRRRHAECFRKLCDNGTAAVEPIRRRPKMAATACQLDPGIREILACLPPGTVVAQLADGSLAICQSEKEADQKIMASRAAQASPDRKPQAIAHGVGGESRC